jgi:hypothetical protein
MNELPHPNPERRWQNMRRMAWAAVVAGVLYPIPVAATGSQYLVDIAAVYYLFLGAVAGAYMGFSTWGDRK